MADFASNAGFLSHALTGLAAWWDKDGMAMTAGAGLAGLGAIALAAAQTLAPYRPAGAPKGAGKSRSARIRQASDAYAEPLAGAATDLLWRFKEIIYDRSGHYLAPSAPSGAYFTYKRQSTAYRLAALLGWMRAIDRAVNLIGAARQETRPALLAALEGVSAALADGPSLEFSRAARLCEIWCLPLFAQSDGQPSDGAPNPQTMRDAIEFDAALRKHIPDVDTSDAHALVAALMKLNRDELVELFRNLAFDLARIRGAAPPSPNHVMESIEDTARALAFREAHIYREWQRAIGDVMIRADRIEDLAAPISVLSFAEYEGQISNSYARSAPWLRRLTDMFEGVEVDSPGEHDSRPRQLRRLAEATATLVLALSKTPRAQNMITKETLLLARALAPGAVRGA